MNEAPVSDTDFDRAMIAGAFSQAAAKGWGHVNIAAVAREAGLPLDRARERFSGRDALLLRFGRMADQAALAQTPTEGTVRDRLFDLIMHRIDFLEQHRAGVLALFNFLPAAPAVALLLGCASQRSLRWLLDASGISTGGLSGQLRVYGLMAVWLWTLRAWKTDEGIDLAHTMAALDVALSRAEGPASWLDRGGRGAGSESDASPQAEAAATPDASFTPPAEPAR